MEDTAQNQQIQQNNKMQIIRDFFNQKKVVIGIGIIIILIIVFLAFLLSLQYPKNAAKTYKIPTLPGSILFNPAATTVGPGESGYASIMVDPGGNPVTGLELAVSFDPKLISNVTLSPYKDTHSAFSYALSKIGNNLTYKDGVIMTLHLPYNVPPQKDGGKVAMITFTVNKNANPSNSTKITLLSVSNFFVPGANSQISTSRNQLEINFSQPFTK